MPAIVSMLRGVNVGGHHKIKMDALRALYESLGLRDARTYIQSGNVVFRSDVRDLARLRKRIEEAIEGAAGFRSDVALRTSADLRQVVARNPFAKRHGLDPRKLLVTFLMTDPGAEARKRVLAIETGPEELRIEGSELFVYFPNGMGRSKLPFALIDKALRTPGTARNWNTVTKLLEMAEALEAPRR